MKTTTTMCSIWIAAILAILLNAPKLQTPDHEGTDVPPVRVAIPSLDLAETVRPMEIIKTARGNYTWRVPDQGVGWGQMGAELGIGYNVVLFAHDYLAFKDLHQLELGSKVLVTGADGKQHTYTITERVITTDRFDVEWVQPTRGNVVTLITCYNFDGVSGWLIVTGVYG